MKKSVLKFNFRFYLLTPTILIKPKTNLSISSSRSIRTPRDALLRPPQSAAPQLAPAEADLWDARVWNPARLGDDQLRALRNVRAAGGEEVDDHRPGEQAAEVDQEGRSETVHDRHSRVLRRLRVATFLYSSTKFAYLMNIHNL